VVARANYPWRMARANCLRMATTIQQPTVSYTPCHLRFPLPLPVLQLLLTLDGVDLFMHSPNTCLQMRLRRYWTWAPHHCAPMCRAAPGLMHPTPTTTDSDYLKTG
jgi:hypothetical protein